jgi:hypothetical protein
LGAFGYAQKTAVSARNLRFALGVVRWREQFALGAGSANRKDMKNALLRIGLVGMMAIGPAACMIDAEYPEADESAPPVVVNAPPPVAPAEVVPVAPAPGYVWVPGYYYWGGRAYVWAPGRYVVGRPGAYWVGPRYYYSGGYHYYYGGRWAYRR